MSQLTPQGFQRDRLDTILANLTARLQAVYGTDCDLDALNPDGQAMGIYAEAASDVWQAAEDIYASFDPNSAVGQALFRLGAFCGITWHSGVYGAVALQVQVTAGETLPAGALVSDHATGVQYATAADVVSSDSSAWYAVTGIATVYGTVKSLANATWDIVTSSYAFIAVKNVVDGTPGSAQETQAQFRARFAQSVAGPSQGMTDGMRAELMKISACRRVKVYENTTSAWQDVHAGDAALAPHSVAVLVEYDSDPAVATAINLRKSQGLTLVGSTARTVTDSAGVAQPIRYSVASATPTALAVTITYKEIPGQGFGGPEGEGVVKAALSDWVAANVDLGGSLNKFDLPAVILGAVVGVGGGRAITIETLAIGLNGGDMSVTDVAVPWNSLAALDEANITMTAVL